MRAPRTRGILQGDLHVVCCVHAWVNELVDARVLFVENHSAYEDDCYSGAATLEGPSPSVMMDGMQTAGVPWK